MKLVFLGCCLILLPFTEAAGLKNVEKILSGRVKNAEQYFLTTLNSTVTDIVNKGIDDVKTLASQGFQALMLNYMNIRANQKANKSSRDISEDVQELQTLLGNIVSLLDAEGQDIHYINRNLMEGLADVTSDVTDMVTDIESVKNRVDKLIKSHISFLDTFVLNTASAVEKRVVDHHAQGKTTICPNCFASVSQDVATSLKPMIDGLILIVNEAGKAISEAAEKVLAPLGLSHQTEDIVTNFLNKESTILTALKGKVWKEMESVTTTV